MAEDRVICCMAVRGARFCMAEVRFCMAEANGGRGFPPSAKPGTNIDRTAPVLTQAM